MRGALALLSLCLSGCFGGSGYRPLAVTLNPIVTGGTVELRIAPFEREVSPYLQMHCALCHAVPTGRAPAFASANLNESFVASQQLVSWNNGSPQGALVQYASNGHCGTPARCGRPSPEWVGHLRAWYEQSESPQPETSPSPSPSASPQSWSAGRQNRLGALPVAWRTESMAFTAAELTLQDPRMRLRLEGQRVSPTELRLRNPHFILSSGAITAGDLIVSVGAERGNGDGDFSQAMRDVAGPTPAEGAALLSFAQTISIAATPGALELFVSFGTLEDSACASYLQFEGQVLPTLQNQCIGCHQATFFSPSTDEGICQTLLSRTLPRDPLNSPLLLRPQGAFGHPVIGLSPAERNAIRNWIETEAALR